MISLKLRIGSNKVKYNDSFYAANDFSVNALQKPRSFILMVYFFVCVKNEISVW